MPENQEKPSNPSDIAGNITKAMAADNSVPEPSSKSTPPPAGEPLFNQQGQQEAAAAATPEPGVAAGESAAAPGQTLSKESLEYSGLIDYAKDQLGIELPFKDDRSAFQALVQGWQQAQQTAPFQPHIAEYLQNQQQYRAWQAERARAEQPKQQPLWNPPASRDEVQKLMAAYYERDDQGNIKAKVDAPYDVRQKVEGYSQYVQDWTTRLNHDPIQALQPLVASMIQPMLQEQQGRLAEDYAAKQALETHASWLYEIKDGQRIMGPEGFHRLSPAGEIYKHYVSDAEAKGVRGVKQIDDYALNMTYAYLMKQQQAAPAAAPAPAAPALTRNEAFTQNNNRRAQVGTAVANGHAPAKSTKGMSLYEQMKSALSEAGIDAGKEEEQELGLAR